MAPFFTSPIDSTEGETLTFYFDRIFTVRGVRYSVSVYITHSPLYHFLMESKKDGWYFSDSTLLPDWIRVLEKNLGQAIEENVSKGKQEG